MIGDRLEPMLKVRRFHRRDLIVVRLQVSICCYGIATTIIRPFGAFCLVAPQWRTSRELPPTPHLASWGSWTCLALSQTPRLRTARCINNTHLGITLTGIILHSITATHSGCPPHLFHFLSFPNTSSPWSTTSVGVKWPCCRNMG